MKTEQHYTPGPWHTQGCTIYSGKNRVAQTWDTCDDFPTPTMEADAGLIAAAPELLEALSDIFGHAERTDAADLAELWGRMDDIRDIACAAIAKAKGGAA